MRMGVRGEGPRAREGARRAAAEPRAQLSSAVTASASPLGFSCDATSSMDALSCGGREGGVGEATAPRTAQPLRGGAFTRCGAQSKSPPPLPRSFDEVLLRRASLHPRTAGSLGPSSLPPPAPLFPPHLRDLVDEVLLRRRGVLGLLLAALHEARQPHVAAHERAADLRGREGGGRGRRRAARVRPSNQET